MSNMNAPAKVDVLAVLRSIHSDPARPVYLTKDLLCLGSIGSAKVFRGNGPAEEFLRENPEFLNLRVETITRDELRRRTA